MLVLNMLTTLKGDDYVYSLLPADYQQRCTTLAQYVQTIPAFYQDTNGRLADAIERLFASLVGRPMFNVLNALMFALLVEGILTLALGRRRPLPALALLLVCVAFFYPYPGETLLWMAGSFNYLWSVTATLWLLCWLRRAGISASWWQHLLIFVYALLAGMLNESVSMACLMGLAGYYLLNRRQFVGMRRTALLAYALGLAVILSSPALWMRLQGGGSVNMQLGVLTMLSRRVLYTGYMALRFVTPVLALAVLVHVWRRQGWRAVARRADLCLWVASVLVVLAVGLLTERPYTFMVCMSMAVVIRTFYPAMLRLKPHWQAALTMVCVVSCAVGAAVAINQVARYRDYDRQVVAQMANGPEQCILRASQPPVDSRWVLPDVYDNNAFYCAYRNYYCAYFGKNNVQFLSPKMYQRYAGDKLLDGAVPVAVSSSDTTRAVTLLAVPGQGYALVPIPDGQQPVNGKGKVFRKDIEQYWGQAVSQRRQLLGSFKDFIPIRPYWLMADGRAYQVIAAEVDSMVTSIELDYLVDGRWQAVTLTRNN